MSEHSNGGYVGGTVLVKISDDECVIKSDRTCARRDQEHAGARIAPQGERFWSCPTHDGPFER